MHGEAYDGYVHLLRGLLADLQKESGKFRLSLRLAAIGLQALLDGLWLEWCLDPDNFSPQEAVALCESWIENLSTGPAQKV